MLTIIFLLLPLPAAVFTQEPAGDRPAHGGLGRVTLLRNSPAEGCIAPASRAWIDAAVRRHREALGLLASRPGGGPSALAPGLYTFYPLAGTFGADIQLGGFVDLDPAPGAFHDFECGVRSYDGHAGIDTPIRSFEEQALGMPVLAARAGTVVFTRDGRPDMNLGGSTDPGNLVVLDEGGGRLAYYFHLKKDSVAVSVGQVLSAGRLLGLAASSGNSFYPHLHFEVRDNGVVYEPFAGPCRPGPSGWLEQPQVQHSFRMLEGAATWQDLFQAQPLPWPQPRDGDFALGDGFVYFWFIAEGLPPNGVWRHVFERPDGTIAFDSGDLPQNNPIEWPWFNGFWYFWIPDMHSITGTWHWRHIVNGVEHVRSPIEVVAARVPGFNRAPLPIDVELEPAAPAPEDAILCRVLTDAVVDDPDYDVLTYRYTWTVDGVVARAVEHAAHADALPGGSAAAGQSVQCTVRASDSLLEGGAALDVLVLGGAPLELAAPEPGTAGTANTWPLDGAAAGAAVYLAYALTPGSANVPGCPGLIARLGSPGLADGAVADGGGHADFIVQVPAAAAGRTLYFQAATLASCELSNLLVYTFP
ncbi:MAG: M23 family metallopeptidase [Planctomycetota bacterium]|nr:MAG: M23 family metallopeptidase [Planctomycetota bacterium]